MLLAIYLNDHLAGATAGVELARRAARSNRDSDYGPFLAELAGQVDEDRRALLKIMNGLGIGVDRLKVIAGWTGEKLGRAKLNGRLRGYSPLSRVVELEGLSLGVRGKLALWRSLERLQSTEATLRDAELSELIARAEVQLERLEQHRLRAVDDALPRRSAPESMPEET
jgi:hypothetical protein